jgi:hypothetical protein
MMYDQYQPEMVSFLRADRSLGAKQEGLTIVHFLNKLIVSCKETVRFPF